MRLFVMRHGNYDLALDPSTGRGVSKLTEEGIQRSRQAAAAFRALLGGGLARVRWYHSPLRRAAETAAEFGAVLGTGEGEPCPCLTADSHPKKVCEFLEHLKSLAAETQNDDLAIVLITHCPVVETALRFLGLDDSEFSIPCAALFELDLTNERAVVVYS